jgi:hypothetical protein
VRSGLKGAFVTDSTSGNTKRREKESARHGMARAKRVASMTEVWKKTRRKRLMST